MNKIDGIISSAIGRRAAEDAQKNKKTKLQKSKKHSYKKGSGNPKNIRTNPRAMKRAAQRTAGLDAINRGKRGVTIKNCGKGNDVAGLVGYATLDKKDHKLLDTNCDDWESFIATTNELKKMRSEIKNNVQHVTVSLRADSNFDLERFDEMLAEIRSDLEVDDSFPFAVVRHFDTSDNNPHCHLIWSRISISGELHCDNSLSFRCASSEQRMENLYQLSVVDMKRQDVKQPSKKELEMQLRTGQPSSRALMQNICSDAMIDCNSISDYFSRLEAAGFFLDLTLQDNNSRISGIVYQLNGQTMKASDLGKKFTANGLQNQGIIYEKNRDGEKITAISNAAAIRYLAANGIEPEYSKFSEHEGVSAGFEAVSGITGTTSRASIKSNAKIGDRDESPVSDAHGDVPNKQSDSAATQAERAEPANKPSNLGIDHSSFESHVDVIVNLVNAITSDSKSTRQQSSGASDSQANAEKPKFAQAAIKQLENLQQNGVTKFEISLHLPLGLRQVDGRYEMAPTEKEQVTCAEHFAKFGEYPKGTMFKRTLENISDFDKHYKFLYIMNEMDVEIYVAPHPDSDHAVTVIDDLNLQQIENMKLDGFEPFCVVESSPSNFQAWVRLSSKSLNYDQRNLMTKKLAQKYDGDRRAVNGVRIGRLQGFTNRKLKHRRAFGQPPPCRVTESRQIIATSGAELIKQIDQDIALDAAAKTRQIRIESIVRPQSREYANYSTSPNEFYRIEANKIMQIYGKETKLSEMDFMIARTMLQKHFTDEQIGHAMQSESPQIGTRHSNLDDYVKRTIAAAKHRESQYKTVANANNKNNKFDDDFSHK